MKFIRIIIAFLCIYAFIGALSLLLVGGTWLNSFYPDIPKNPIANINTQPIREGKALISYKEVLGTTGLTTLFMRNKSPQSKAGKGFFSTSSTLFITYEYYLLKPTFAPLGFTSLYRTSLITDATGSIIYQRNPNLTDRIMSPLLHYFVQSTEKVTTAIVARPQEASYTVTVSTDGVTKYEN